MNISRHTPPPARVSHQRAWHATIQRPIVFSASKTHLVEERPPKPPAFHHLLEAQTPKIPEPSNLKRLGLIGLAGLGIVGSAMVFPPILVFFSAALISLHAVTLSTYGSWENYKKYMTAPRPFRMTPEQAREENLYWKALCRYNRRQKLKKIGRFFEDLWHKITKFFSVKK